MLERDVLLLLLSLLLSSALAEWAVVGEDDECEIFYPAYLQHEFDYLPSICIANWYELKNILVGSDINITCVTHPKVFGSILYDINFSSSTGVFENHISNRAEILAPRRLKVNDHEIVSQTALLRNVSKLDNGFYTCDIRKDMSHRIHLEVFEEKELFLNLTLNQPHVHVNAGSTAQWFGSVDSYYPVVLSVQKQNPYEASMSMYNKKKRDIFKQNGTTFSLTISPVSYSDFGNHSFIARNENRTIMRKAAFSLKVNYPPVISVTNKVTRVDGHHMFLCSVSSFPPANVYYYFKACNSENSSDCESFDYVPWGSPQVRNYRPPGVFVSGVKGDFEGAADYAMWKNASESGHFMCMAENSMGRTNSSAYVCVTDGPLEPKMVAPKAIYVGEDLVVTCNVSLCNFHEDIKIYARDPHESRQQIFFKESYGLFSKQLTMTIVNVDENNTGLYYCKHRKRADYLDISKTIVTVLVLPERDTPRTLWWLLAAAVFAILTMLLVVGRYIIILRRKKQLNLTILLQLRKGNTAAINPDLPLHEQSDLLPFDPKWEVPRNKLKLGKQLGAGFFGVVYYADAEGIVGGENNAVVAVKMAKKHSDPEVVRALVGELKIMAHLGSHPNVVKLLGTVIDNLSENELMLIVEYCPYGSLNTYLVKNRARYVDELDAINNAADLLQRQDSKDELAGLLPLNTRVLVSWAYQIAKGMDWLAGRKVLHGDLAARNVLLSEGNVVKISDFGLAKSLYSQQEYQKTKGGAKLPVKWMAIESVKARLFSTKSDVWSYGILLWELFTLGNTPYPEFDTFPELLRKLELGYRMAKPVYAPQDMYDIMESCWKDDPQKRPDFSDICDATYSRLENATKDLYLDLEVVDTEDLLDLFSAPNNTYANLPSSSCVEDNLWESIPLKERS